MGETTVTQPYERRQKPMLDRPGKGPERETVCITVCSIPNVPSLSSVCYCLSRDRGIVANVG